MIRSRPLTGDGSSDLGRPHRLEKHGSSLQGHVRVQQQLSSSLCFTGTFLFSFWISAVTMPHSPAAAHDQWGYLIKPDKTAAPLLEELLLGIAHYIVSSTHPVAERS